MSLLTETTDCITTSGHTPKDIIFIGSANTGYSCTWEEFKKLALFDYDNGFGSAQIAIDLIIVFADGQQMTRKEYDGSEWWQFTIPFKMPKKLLPIIRLGVGMWDTLESMHDPDNQAKEYIDG